MADMNYVSPLTSDLTDYYTKSEVDELQQGDAATYATSAEIVAGDNAVKGWVASQGYLTEHQDLTNYATKDYVAAAVEDIEAGGGVKIEVVATLPTHPEENVIYLTRKNESDTDNIYNEWIWVADTESYELIGDTSSGVIPDLSDYATKDYVDDELANKVNTADLATVATSGDYEDLSNKPTIPSLTGYATEAYVNNAVGAIRARDVAYDNSTSGLAADTVQNAINEVNDKVEAIDVPDVSEFATAQDIAGLEAEIALKQDASTLAAVATTGSYNDLTNKPAIPDVSSLTAEDIGYSNPDRYTYAQKITNVKKVINFLENRLDETVKSSSLAAVATSGSYTDLTDKPTIPAAPDLTPYATKQELTAKADAASLATVATSGSYNDLSDKPTIPQDTGITSAAGALPLAFIGMNDAQTYCNISRLSNNQDKVKAFNSGYLCRIAANDSIALLPEEAILPGSDNTSRFRGYSINSNGTYSTGNESLTNGYYYIYGASIVQRISPNAYIICYENTQDIAQFYKNILLTYSNTTSGLTATTIQGAIDELAAASGSGSEVGWSYDSSTGYMTFTGMLEDDGRQEVRLCRNFKIKIYLVM